MQKERNFSYICNQVEFSTFNTQPLAVMKKIIYIIFLLSNLGIITAQNLEESLVSTFNTYRSLIEAKKYDNGLDYYHKSFLDYIPKKFFLKEFEKFNNSLSFTYYVTDSKILSKSKILKNEEKSYSLIEYETTSHIIFSDTVSVKYIDGKIKHYKLLYGKNSQYIEGTKEIINHKKGLVIGIYDNSWFFIPYKDKLKTYMHLWLPEEIIEKLIK